MSVYVPFTVAVNFTQKILAFKVKNRRLCLHYACSVYTMDQLGETAT